MAEAAEVVGRKPAGASQGLRRFLRCHAKNLRIGGAAEST
jgi:hypothetical protein